MATTMDVDGPFSADPKDRESLGLSAGVRKYQAERYNSNLCARRLMLEPMSSAKANVRKRSAGGDGRIGGVIGSRQTKDRGKTAQ